MQTFKSVLTKSSCLALTLGLTSVANASPIYVLLEGTITASSSYSGLGPPVFNSRVGDTIKIQAAWDSDLMFGSDGDSSANAGSFGSKASIQVVTIQEPWGFSYGTAIIGQHADGTHFSNPISVYPIAIPSYSVSRNGGQSGSVYLDSYDMQYPQETSGGGWNISLKTENLTNGSHVVLSVVGDTSDTYASSDNNFSLDLTSSSSIINADLETFLWNSLQGGTASGILGDSFYYSGEEQGHNTDTIQWSRAVLSFNQADLNPVPVPGAGWLLSSAIVGLVAAKKRRH